MYAQILGPLATIICLAVWDLVSFTGLCQISKGYKLMIGMF